MTDEHNVILATLIRTYGEENVEVDEEFAYIDEDDVTYRYSIRETVAEMQEHGIQPGPITLRPVENLGA